MEFSKTKQSFKIGRMIYSLPNCVTIKYSKYRLNFYFDGKYWVANYVRLPIYDDDVESILDCSELTFNKALKALHKKVKEHETGTN